MKRRGLKILISLLLALIVLFFFPVKEANEIYFVNTWNVDLTQTEGDPAAPVADIDRVVPFYDGETAGFIRDDGKIFYSETVFYKAAVSGQYFVNYSSVSEMCIVKDMYGEIISSIATKGYPLISDDRLFIFDADRSGVGEYDFTGRLLWRRRFPGLITSFDSGARTAGFGFIGGGYALFDGEGGALLSDRYDESGLSVVYSVAVDEVSNRFALVAGIDPQRVIVFQEGESGYVEIFNTENDTEFRREVFLDFIDNGTKLVIEQNKSIEVIDLQKMKTEIYPLKGVPRKVFFYPLLNAVIVHEESKNSGFIRFFSERNMELAVFPVKKESTVFHRGNSVYYRYENEVQRVDLGEY